MRTTDVCIGEQVCSSLESDDDVALARDWIRLFAVDGKVVVVPEDVWLRVCGTRWTCGRGKRIALVLGLGDNAAHGAARFGCKGHLNEKKYVLKAVADLSSVVVYRLYRRRRLSPGELRSHVSVSPMTTISSSFEPFREHLDEHHDRRDRLIKVLRMPC